MDIPEAKADINNNNITIHQLLRIVYNDQSNPASFLFNIEPPFDSAFKRETVGNYLLGLHDDDLYSAKIQLAAEEKKLEKAITKLQAIYSILGKTDYTSDLDNIDKARETYLQAIDKLNGEIQEARLSTETSSKAEKSITEKQAGELINAKAKLLECESQIRFMKYEIDDSDDFLRELKNKSSALSDSIKVGTIYPKIVFDICPSCYKKIEPKSDNCCHLCGADQEDNGHSRSTNLLRMKNEVDIQIRESTKLLAKKIDKLSLLNKEKTLYSAELRKSISKVSATITAENTVFETKVYELYQKIGETEQKLEQLSRSEELSKTVRSLIEDKQNSQAEVNRLKNVIDLKQGQFLRRTPEIHQAISEHLISILKQDNGAEKEFKNAMTIEFDFASNMVAVNTKTAFSESGNVLLNNAFHVALLITSLEKGYVRVPRLMILDGIENGGMEDSRSKNFQRVVKEYLESYKHPYQLIFATKSIYEGLDSEQYIVGQKYSEDNKSLKM